MQTELIEQPQAWSKQPDTPGTVLAKWLDNAGAGIGAMAVVGVLAWLVSRDWATVAWWSLPAGVALFGALMIARAALDEVFAYSDYRAMLADIDSLTQQLEDAETTHDEECDRLTTRIRVLQADLNAERQRNWDRHAGPRSRSAIEIPTEPTAPDPVRDDAEKLLERAYSANPWGKDNMRLYCNMTSPQWYAARNLLIARGIVARGKNQTVLLQPTLTDALAALHGVEVAEK
jgi:hypothetical protein